MLLPTTNISDAAKCTATNIAAVAASTASTTVATDAVTDVPAQPEHNRDPPDCSATDAAGEGCRITAVEEVEVVPGAFKAKVSRERFFCFVDKLVTEHL